MRRLRFLWAGLATVLGLAVATPGRAQAPANDQCGTAQVAATNGTAITGTTLNAADDLIGLLGCQSGAAAHPDVWYRFTATGTRLSYTVTAAAGTPLEVLAFDGACAAGLLVLRADCGSGTVTGSVGGLVVGQDYRVAVASPSAAAAAAFTIQITNTTPSVTAAQDCNQAAILTSPVTITQGASNQGNGTVTTEVTTSNSCWGSGTERQSKWYKFVAGSTGKLLFNIQPNVSSDDYDWAVWDITGDPTGCTTKGNAIACNWTGATGATGLSLCKNQEPGYVSPSGGLVDPFANETTNQTGANAPITVQGGRVYALLVDNFSMSSAGFTLRFGGACNPAPGGQAVALVGLEAEFNYTKTSCGVVNFFKTRPLVAGTTATFFWNFGDGATSTLPAPTHTYAQGAVNTYTVTLQIIDALGGRYTYSRPVLIAPPTVLVASATGSTAICSGQSLTLLASGADTYTWSPATGLNTTTGATVIATPTQNTTYTVTGTKDLCTASATVTVVIAPPPVARVLATGPTTLCAGQSVILTARGGTSYQWTPATGLSSATDSIVTASPTQTTTYTVIVSRNGCTSLATQTVTVTPQLNLQISPTGATSICAGQGVGLRARGGTAGTTYQWSPATGLSSTTDSAVVAAPAQTTTYTVTASQGACSTTQTVIVTVSAPLNLQVAAAGPTTVCAGQSVSFSATGGAGTTYLWSPVTDLSSTTDSTVIATPSQTTTYTVTATRGACSASRQVTVTVSAPLSLQVAAASPTLCAGASTPLTAQGGGAGTTYQWSPAAGLSSTTDSTVIATPGQTTTYTVTATRGACSATQTVTLTVTAPLAITVSAAGPTTLCAGESVGLAAAGTSAGGPASYVWSPAAGLSSTTDSTVTAAPTQTTTYTVTATRGTCTTTQDVTVTVIPLPTTQATASAAAICAGSTTTLTATGADRYVWTPAPGLAAADTANATVTVNPTVPTTYTVTGYRGTSECPVTTTVTVDVTSPQLAAGTVADSVGLAPHTTSFTAAVPGATAYLWTFGDGQTSTEMNPTHTYTATGTYPVTLSATYGPAGCQTAARQVTTVVVQPGNVYNILTPNGDGKNDVFAAPASGQALHLQVFNRWGRKVLDRENYQQDWNGDDLPAGTYYYQLEATGGGRWKGWLEIVR